MTRGFSWAAPTLMKINFGNDLKLALSTILNLGSEIPETGEDRN